MSTQESSLTSPFDRDTTNKWKPQTSTQPLTDEETKNAISSLHKDVRTFPSVERVYTDPSIPMQNYCLVSFIPSKGATPDKHGIYGFAKVRGVYNTVDESDVRVDYLIRNVDSYHTIYTAKVGHPFPMTTTDKYSADHKEIDIRKQMSDSISSDVKSKRDEEAKAVKEIKEREKKLQEDVSKTDIDPVDRYSELRTKKAQLIYTYMQSKEQQKKIREIVSKTMADIEEMDKVDSSYKDQYLERIKKAREEVGIKDDMEQLKNTFMIYLSDDTTMLD